MSNDLKVILLALLFIGGLILIGFVGEWVLYEALPDH